MTHALDAYRKANDLSLRALADRVGGITAASLSRIIRREQDPSMDLIRRVRDATGGAVTADDFLPPVTEAAE